MPFDPLPSPARRQSIPRRFIAAAALCSLIAACGCSRFRPHSQEQYVYVITRQSILRDRVAAVSNRTGEVTNGEKLQVLERDRRFVKVKAPDGAIGWLEARLTADQALADQFDALHKDHLHDPVVASATVDNDVYLHISPGRETDRFFRLSEGAPLSLLQRAAVLKPVSSGAAVADAAKLKPGQAPPPPPMEDWWLVRGPHGETGWVYAGLIDLNVPAAIAGFAEGQRIVGAYVLATVNDPDYAAKQNQPSAAIPEYLTVVNAPKAGLPYDFDQVRVFIWNLKKHRYETSFRERNMEGFLPVKLFKSKDPYGKDQDAAQLLPTFSYTVLAADAPTPTPDPPTSKTPGLIRPARTITKTYRLEGNICRRLLPPNTPPPAEAHPAPESKKEKARPGRRKR
jgi:SH3-like domain-containing protein